MIVGLDWQLIVELLLVGCATGFMAGLLGIGGAMLMVPFMTWMLTHHDVANALAVKMAIATSMATIVFTSLSSIRAHNRRKAIRWDIVRTLAPGITLMALLIGAFIYPLVKGSALAMLFALLVSFSATQMLLNRKPRPTRQLPGTAGRLVAGGVIGAVSGLVGAGGGFISVPFMTWCNVPIHNAVATSAALGFPIAVASTLGNVIGGWSVHNPMPGGVGYLWLPALAVIVMGSMLFAPLGAKTAHAMNIASLQRVFALMLYALAAYMLYKAFA